MDPAKLLGEGAQESFTAIRRGSSQTIGGGGSGEFYRKFGACCWIEHT